MAAIMITLNTGEQHYLTMLCSVSSHKCSFSVVLFQKIVTCNSWLLFPFLASFFKIFTLQLNGIKSQPGTVVNWRWRGNLMTSLGSNPTGWMMKILLTGKAK